MGGVLGGMYRRSVLGPDDTEAWLEVALDGVMVLRTMALRGASGYPDGGDSACGSHKADWLWLIDVSRC